MEDHPRRCGENGADLSHSATALGSPPQVRGKPMPLAYCTTPHRITPAGAGKTLHTFLNAASAKDHPRRCGENRQSARSELLDEGSPPQVRGKLNGLPSGFSISRITPAGAGKTLCAFSFAVRTEDHPRRCGENSSARLAASQQAGSPPQVRGKHGVEQFIQSILGITPAGAGKTTHCTCQGCRIRDHPRRCGENVVHAVSSITISRITPAGAGKTQTAYDKMQ